MTAPATKTTRVLHIGRRFSWAQKPEGRVVRVHDKLRRRIERGRATRASSRIERALEKSRRADYDVQKLATNSHEAKRYIAAARMERR
jgi:hypothetical protein